MNFEHSDSRRMLADMLGRFLNERYGFEERNRIAYSEHGYSREVWQELAELGIVSALFEESEGGLGGAGFDLAVLFEALGRALVVEPFLNVLLAGKLIARRGNDEQKGLLAQMMAGSCIPAFAHYEPEGRYDLHHVASTARTTADGFVIDGHKAVVCFGDRSDVIVVSARTNGDIDALDGVSLFVVPADIAGLHIRGYANVDGGRGAELHFDAVKVGAEHRLGALGDAHAHIEEAVAAGILALSAQSLGAMEMAKNATVDYFKTRQQFGVPIGKFQALQHRMADILLEIEQSRSAVINAANALAADRHTRERAASAAKYTLGRVGTLVAEETVQMHGGIGVTWELPLGHYAKCLTMADHQLGDEDHHLQRFIALGRS
jgi:alkylation response protein AidB-like acyl-CoA dehydrogenase